MPALTAQVEGLAARFLNRLEEALAIQCDGVRDEFTHNRAIRKLKESCRVSDADKRMLQALRRKAANPHE